MCCCTFGICGATCSSGVRGVCGVARALAVVLDGVAEEQEPEFARRFLPPFLLGALSTEFASGLRFGARDLLGAALPAGTAEMSACRGGVMRCDGGATEVSARCDGGATEV